jgi:uncharacterized protein YndB with AHSA1/START domain
MWRWLLGGVIVAAGVLVVLVVVGWMLPQGHVTTRESTVPRPVPDVYAAISDVARYAEWRDDVRVVTVLAEGPVRWREEGAHGAITFEVEEAEAPTRLVTRIADPDLPFGGRWIFELTAVEGGTRVSITEEGEVYNPVFRVLSRFVFGHAATLDAYLRNLGRRFP